jgi:hypothetical protein
VNTSANPVCVTVIVFPLSDPVSVDPSLLNVKVTAVPFSENVPLSTVDCVLTDPFCVIRKVVVSVKVPLDVAVTTSDVISVLSVAVCETVNGNAVPLTVCSDQVPATLAKVGAVVESLQETATISSARGRMRMDFLRLRVRGRSAPLVPNPFIEDVVP